ncbi:MAG TPA: PhzF family phenazine biosynthesis protein [Aliidongia sp.]|uniref:PhzF family phenazine biosynthesis protein n=1 Tax=Aliidongia sp. TaxID=1914230 RepID=UPI002DDD1AB8|nr:PhzF family phenazine biosynthesis protein [Aliidongia sp.]HEV2673179.1 PhzF family phenazine biosynthesis protein [Aliidongia sp.]
MRRRYVTVDVFTDRPFGGNPLAVVLDAGGLSTAQMQAVASEFNYSETTFVLPPDDPAHTAKVRIFTPRTEVPFAGHPNVGTAFVLARQAQDVSTLPERLVFEEAAGLVPVRLLREGDHIVGAELTAPERLSRRSQVTPAEAAACLSLVPSDIRTVGHPPQVVSVGLPFLVVEIASRTALRRAKSDLSAHEDLLPLDGADCIYLYTKDGEADGATVNLDARMFSPLDGIPEDPATGSAAAALSGLLAELGSESDFDATYRIVQGVDMGRPSLLVARASKRRGVVDTIRVGGHCVGMMEGSFLLRGEA